jgi:hypothetical protein
MLIETVFPQHVYDMYTHLLHPFQSYFKTCFSLTWHNNWFPEKSSHLCGLYCMLRAMIAQSVWHWATGWTVGVLRFDSRLGLRIFLFTTASRTALGPTQPPTQWVLGVLSVAVKRPGREADHSSSSSADVKEYVELYLHSPIRLHGVVVS